MLFIKYPSIRIIRLSVAIFIGCCACKGTDSDNSHTNNPHTNNPHTNNPNTLLLCTANIFQLNKASATNILQQLKGLQKPTDDVVVFAFQEAIANKWKDELKTALNGFKIYECPTDQGDFLDNTVAVYVKNPYKIQSENFQLPLHATPRSACVVQLPTLGLVFANVHLFGGRYDDQKWADHQQARGAQMQAIVQKYKPSIVLGDFNADDHYPADIDTGSYWKAKLGTKNPQTLQKFLTGVHTYLAGTGYKSVIDRSQIATTTPFGVVSDWIYQASDLGYTVQEWGIIPAINKNFSI